MIHVKKMRMKVGLLAVGLLLWTAATAQTGGRSLSLQEAKQIALENNTSIKNAKLDVSIAKKKVIETTAIGLPQVSATANYQHLFNVPSFSFPTTGYTKDALFPGGKNTWPQGFAETTNGTPGGLNQYFYSGEGFPISPKDNTVFKLQVSQLIFSGEYIVGLQATRVYKLISEQSLTKSKIETESMVESTYYLALALAENLKMVSQNRKALETNIRESEAIQKAGFVDDVVVDQLRVNLSSLSTFEQSIEGQMKNVVNQLKYLIGSNLNEEIVLSDNLDRVISEISPFDGREFNLNQNIDYKIVQNAVSAQKLNLRREQSAYLPTLAAFYQHQEKQKVPALDFEPKDVLGVTLSIPIFSSGSRLMKVKQAKLAYEKAINSQVDAEKGLQLKYDNQRLNYQTAYNNFLNHRQNSEVCKSIYDKTNEKLKQGMASSMELSVAQTQYLTAVNNYYTSVFSLLNARVELQKLMTPSN